MEEHYTVYAEGYELRTIEAFAPEHAAELFADLVCANDGLVVEVRGEGTFQIRARKEYYAVRMH